MQKVYPRIQYVTKIITENGRQALAVIIPGSELRPHFAGLAYIRRGSESLEASGEQYEELITQRNNKSARILAWKDKKITVIERTPWRVGVGERPWAEGSIMVNCDQFYVTLLESPTGVAESYPLTRVEINFDNLRHRLKLEIEILRPQISCADAIDCRDVSSLLRSISTALEKTTGCLDTTLPRLSPFRSSARIRRNPAAKCR